MFDEPGEFYDENSDVKGFWEDVAKSFEEPIETFEKLTPIYSNLWSGGYEEDWLIIYRDEDGQLWACKAGHCSCNGFEGQWGGVACDLASIEKDYHMPEADAERLRALLSEQP